jgi:hypothetical protein
MAMKWRKLAEPTAIRMQLIQPTNLSDDLHFQWVCATRITDEGNLQENLENVC